MTSRGFRNSSVPTVPLLACEIMVRIATNSLLLLLAAAGGCANLPAVSDALNPFVKRPTIAGASNPAIEMACVWQPGEGPGGHGVPARGFAGQVYFFTKRDPEPVLVNGTVRIYLFADRGTPEERARPLKQFDFSPEAWATRATVASLGPGYSVFIPYPATEAYQVRCELRARFTPNDGGPQIWSEGVTMVLDGPPRPGDEPAWWARIDRSKSPPTVASYEIGHKSGTLSQLNGDDHETAKPVDPLRTQTIPLGPIRPASFQTSHESRRPQSGSQAQRRVDSQSRRLAERASRRSADASSPDKEPASAGELAPGAFHPLGLPLAKQPQGHHPLDSFRDAERDPADVDARSSSFQQAPSPTLPGNRRESPTASAHPLDG